MLLDISSKIADNLISSDHIDQDERDIYIFGLNTLLIHLLNFLSMLLIAALMRQSWEYLLFMFLFIPLRSYAGGYHASSPMRCYVLSTGIMVMVLLLVKLIGGQADLWLGIGLLAVSTVLIFILAPVENANKPLDTQEKMIFGRRAKITLIIELLLSALCWSCSWNVAFWTAVAAITVAAASLVIERIVR